MNIDFGKYFLWDFKGYFFLKEIPFNGVRGGASIILY